MSIIKETIKFNNRDVILKINLGVDNRFSGYQQEIDTITEETKISLINPIIDNDVKRFQYYNNGQSMNLIFNFTPNGSSYKNSLSTDGARFTNEEIKQNNNKLLNSFFIMDFYDTFNNNTQTKIFTNYLTKVLDGEKGTVPIPKYIINNTTKNQLYSWYVPNSFINKQTGDTVIGYVKFSFYNAKFGDLALFLNKDKQEDKTPEKMYFKTLLDLKNMTWKFIYTKTGIALFPPNATAEQLPFNNTYSKRINKNINSFDNKKQVFPTGTSFQTIDGTYKIS